MCTYKQIAIKTTPEEHFVDFFRDHNLMVTGAKGTGKDTSVMHMLNLLDKPHYANMPYDYKDSGYTARKGDTTIIKVSDLACGDNQFSNFLNDDIKPYHSPFRRGSQIVISDGGVFLPSHRDAQVKEEYPGIDSFYALARQLGVSIQINCQQFERVLKLVREQCDGVMHCLGCQKYSDYNVVNGLVYERWQSAVSGKRISSLANGKITKFRYKIAHRDIHFDTLFFAKKLLLNYQAPKCDKNNLMEALKNV